MELRVGSMVHRPDGGLVYFMLSQARYSCLPDGLDMGACTLETVLENARSILR